MIKNESGWIAYKNKSAGLEKITQLQVGMGTSQWQEWLSC